jgi:dipeptidyl-peptidase-4
MNDGIHYSTLERDTVFKYEYSKASKPEMIVCKSNLVVDGKELKIDTYQFSADESKMLIATDKEQVYRHSTRENYYVYDRKTKTISPISTTEKTNVCSLFT